MSTGQRLVRSSWSPAPIVQMGSLRLREAEKHVQCLLGVSLYQAGTPEPTLLVAVSPRVPAMHGGLDRCLGSCGLSGGAAEPVALSRFRLQTSRVGVQLGRPIVQLLGSNVLFPSCFSQKNSRALSPPPLSLAPFTSVIGLWQLSVH